MNNVEIAKHEVDDGPQTEHSAAITKLVLEYRVLYDRWIKLTRDADRLRRQAGELEDVATKLLEQLKAARVALINEIPELKP